MNVWNDVLAHVEKRLNANVFDTWFRRITFDGFDPETRTINLIAADITKDWVTRYYSPMIDEILGDMGLDGYQLEWDLDEQPTQNLNGLVENEADNHDRALRVIANDDSAALTDSSLNPKYTFEKFVVGTSNQFAHAAAKGAADSPGKSYNPLFLYGGTGLGKTHLMHAIGHSIKENNKHLSVAYVTSEKFMNELINAIRFDKTEAFRAKYRSIDVLLMDDIQFFAGKERTQTEFFHTFNTLHNDQKQIVLTSDCPPREIPTLEERLHSRFEWGQSADIEPPDLETKVAILKRKADMDGIDLTDEIAIFIASKIKSNVRELEGSLLRLVAIASLRGVPISKMVAQEAMKSIIESERAEGLTMERIARTVAAHYQMSVEELKSKNNSRAIAMPRQVAMYLCKRLTRHSYPEIGREFGGKHHTTVMHSFDKIENLTRADRVFHNTISSLIDSLCS
ncbi:MAG: chromosomal replication initiator protein DnaA [Acidobacteria bacterium]|nr:MAG: chromosomal replication initiator protein DnaA [Acidobacteriota bacterium]